MRMFRGSLRVLKVDRFLARLPDRALHSEIDTTLVGTLRIKWSPDRSVGKSLYKGSTPNRIDAGLLSMSAFPRYLVRLSSARDNSQPPCFTYLGAI